MKEAVIDLQLEERMDMLMWQRREEIINLMRMVTASFARRADAQRIQEEKEPNEDWWYE